MITLADYENWKSKQQKSGVGAASVVLGSVEDGPDQIAADLQIASEFGKVTGNPVPPAPMVKEYRSVFQAAIEKKRTETILTSSPRLTEWLRNTENASLARDDLEGLSWFERMGKSFDMGNATAVTQGREVMRDTGAVLETSALGRGLDAAGDVFDETVLTNGEGDPNLLGRLANYLRGRASEADGVERQMVGGPDMAPEQRGAALAKQDLGVIYDAGKAMLEDLSKQGFEPMSLKDVKGLGSALSFITENIAMSAPQMAATMASGGFGPFVNLVLSTGEVNNELAGKLPDMEPANRVALAFGAGTAVAALDVIGMGKVFGGLGVTEVAERAAAGTLVEVLVTNGMTKAGASVMSAAIAEGTTEALQEAIMMGATSIAGGEYTGEEVIDRLAQSFFAGAGAGGGMHAGGKASSSAAAAGARMAASKRKATAAKDRVAVFEALSGHAQSSKLRKRMPEKFRQFVERATADGPVENVYIPADQFVAYFQDQGLDPYKIAGALEGVSADDLRDAVNNSIDLKIPTSTYAASLAGSDVDGFLMQNMRFDPNEMTAAEAKAQAFNEKASDAMAEAWETAEAMRQEDEKWRGAEEKIYDEMVSRLRVAGRSTDVATSEAMIYPAFYRVMAERSGLTTDEFLTRYPLPQVRGALPEALAPKNVDELTRTLAEARNRRAPAGDKRQSLLEFIADRGGINDRGGELDAMDAATITRGRGKKALKLKRETAAEGQGAMFGSGDGGSYGPDNVALAAIEAGFMADHPAVIEYKAAMERGDEAPDLTRALWDAIGAEVRGETQFSDQDTGPVDESHLDEIERYLAQIGLSLDDDDATIRAGIEAARDEDARMYGQNGGLLFQRNETGPRGQISIDRSGAAIISLFETADLSTMLHESGHFFLTVIQDLASKGEGQSVAEYEAIKGWWRDNAAAVAADGLRVMPDTGVTADDVKRAIDLGTTGDVLKDAAIDIGMQEQWTRAFETYLMEGKAPSVELRGAFDKFRSWLISIYKRLTGTNVKVSDGIRQVFDRMLASDNEIAAAKADTGDMGPVFATAEEMGLTAEEYAAFIKLRGEADADSQARMLAEAMAPIKRERDEWFKKEKAAVREAVEREINSQPVYRAYEWLGNARWLGADEPQDMPKMKLSKDVLVDRYGAGVLKTLSDGRNPVYSAEGGADPDMIAAWFGFGSGDQMVKAIEAAPNRKAAIAAETDRRMYELHGDVLRDGTAEAVALDAVHTDKKGQWLARELKAVIDIAGAETGLTAKEARAAARDTITRMKARDAVNSNRFLAAERKAGQEAASLGAMLAREGLWAQAARRRIASKARGVIKGEGTADGVASQIDKANASTSNYNETVGKLIAAKRRQLLNHALYMESRNAADEVAKAESYIAKLNKSTSREKIAGAGRRENAQIDYLAAIDDLQGRYDFRRMSGPAEARRGALQAYIDAMTAAGRENELSIPEKVRSNAARTPYKTLPMEELRGVIDSLKNLEHTAKRWNDLISGQRKRDFEETRDKIVDTIKTNTTEKPISWDAPANGWMKTLKDLGHDYIAGIYHASTILRRLDNTEDYGTVYDAIKTEIDEAAYGEREMRAKAARDIEAIMSVYSAEEQRDMGIKRHIPALGASFSKWHLISMARNMGNAGNLARLTNPKAAMHLTEPQVEVVKTLLDKRDWDYVQAIWDYNDTYRPLMAERERRVKGTEPTWVEATPVNTPHGQYRGGYFPIKYDGRLGGGRSDLTGTDEEVLQRMMKGGFVSASTKDGHLQARGANVDQSLTLEPGAWGMHVAEVIHDLTHSEAVINSFRLLTSAEVKSAMLKAGMDAEYNFLRLWLLDAASGQLGADSRVASAMQKVRNGFAFSKLAWSVKTALMQPLGIVQSAVVVGKKNLAVAVADYLKHPQEVSAEAMAKSRVLWERRETFQKDLMDAQAEGSIVSPSTSKAADLFDQYVVRYGTAGMVYTQLYTVDVPTWVAGYRLGLEKFDGNETKAIAFADNALHRAQSSGIWSDRSGYERGSLGMRSRQSAHVMLLTTLGSYFFAKTNLIIDRTNRLNSKPITATEAMDYAFDMFLIVLGETVALSMIDGATALAFGDDGGDDDDDDESLISSTLLGGVQTITAGLPFIRDAASAASGFDGGTYDSLIGTMIKPFQQALQGEVDKSLVKGAINLGGMLFRLPSAQANRSLDAAWRAMEGEEVSPIEYVMGKQR